MAVMSEVLGVPVGHVGVIAHDPDCRERPDETYLVGWRDTEVAARWRTEIGWPIFRLAPA
jgi:hypothetical protein